MKIIISSIIILIIVLISIYMFMFNDVKSIISKSDDSNDAHELTLKQIYTIFLETSNKLHKSDFDNIKNMNLLLLLHIRNKMLMFEKIDCIIDHTLKREKLYIYVKFIVRLINGQYSQTEWIFNKHNNYIQNIDKIIKEPE